MAKNLTPAMLEILKRALAGFGTTHDKYSVVSALRRRGLVKFAKTQAGYAVRLTPEGEAAARAAGCNCGAASGVRRNHEAECSGAYL